MKPKTEELLKACKEAGYKFVTIFVRDSKVPFSKKIKVGAYWGFGSRDAPNKVVCATPEQYGALKGLPGDGWPKIWGIVGKLKLSRAGFGGGGLGDSHEVHGSLIIELDAGVYEL